MIIQILLGIWIAAMIVIWLLPSFGKTYLLELFDWNVPVYIAFSFIWPLTLIIMVVYWTFEQILNER